MVDFIHPLALQRLLLNNPTFYPHVVTIQNPPDDTIQDGAGQPSGPWIDAPGLVGLRCRIGPAVGGERKEPRQVWSAATHIVAFTEALTGVNEKMRVINGTQILDILLVQEDSTGSVTQLVCQVAR